MRILVVEDDEYVAQVLKILLASYNYAVDVALNGEAGLELTEAFDYDLIILDLILPKLDGISLCQQLRAKGDQMPILLLTGHGSSHEKAIALNAGADDYVVKPFDPEELIARVQALLRRGRSVTQPILTWGNLRLDPSSRAVTYDSHPLALTPKEYALLELFLRNSQRVFSPKAILDHVWTGEAAPGEEAVRVHVKGLRQKLKAAGAPADWVETVYGVGYRLKSLETSAVPGETNPRSPLMHPLPLEASSSDTKAPNSSLSTVMVVTQDSRLLTFLTALLEPYNLKILSVTDPRQFWEALEARSPDVLVLDVELSPVDGIELCQSVRCHSRWQELPIILLTPNPQASLIHQVFAAGADDFVSKPIAGPELVTRINNRLERFQLLRHIAES